MIKDENKLIARTPEKFRESGVNVLLGRKVESVDQGDRKVRLSNGSIIPYDILMLATGTVAVIPNIPGAGLNGVFALKNLENAIRIKSYLGEKHCRRAIIVGAGFIGLEMCESFRALGMEVTAMELLPRPAVRWDSEFSQLMVEVMEKNQVTFLPETQIQSIEPGKDHYLHVATNRGDMECDIILLALGVRPEVTLARQMGIRIGESGAIAVNASQETSLKGVYAAGDCCESFHRISRRWVHMPLGDVANKQGRITGGNMGGHARIFPGVIGAQSFKFFELEVAATGVNEQEALEAGFQPVSSLIWGNAVASSMPEPRKIGLKLVADRATGRLLGAQAIGEMGAVSRVNVLSAALWAEMSLDDAGYMDLAYSPPYSSAWDVIHIAAQTLKRKM